MYADPHRFGELRLRQTNEFSERRNRVHARASDRDPRANHTRIEYTTHMPSEQASAAQLRFRDAQRLAQLVKQLDRAQQMRFGRLVVSEVDRAVAAPPSSYIPRLCTPLLTCKGWHKCHWRHTAR